jgi:hypothetical protein
LIKPLIEKWLNKKNSFELAQAKLLIETALSNKKTILQSYFA